MGLLRVKQDAEKKATETTEEKVKVVEEKLEQKKGEVDNAIDVMQKANKNPKQIDLENMPGAGSDLMSELGKLLGNLAGTANDLKKVEVEKDGLTDKIEVQKGTIDEQHK